MLMYLWMCVMLNAFAPAGPSLARHAVDQMQSYMRSQFDFGDFADEVTAPLTPTQRVRQARSTTGFAR